jgi:hypothetical protein
MGRTHGGQPVPDVGKALEQSGIVDGATECFQSIAVPSSDYRRTANEEIVQQDDQGEHEQQVDEPTSHVKRKEAEQPDHEQDHKERPKHTGAPL